MMLIMMNGPINAIGSNDIIASSHILSNIQLLIKDELCGLAQTIKFNKSHNKACLQLLYWTLLCMCIGVYLELKI